jgi:hypothetical protein
VSASFGQLSDDAEIAAFAESIELALVDSYELAKTKLTTAEVVAAADEFRDHHSQHAVAFAATAGRRATGRANPKLAEDLGAAVLAAADEDETMAVLFDAENALSSTYLAAVGAFGAKEARELAASVLAVEGGHAAVFGLVIDRSTETVFPIFETPDRAFDPDEYPVEE